MLEVILQDSNQQKPIIYSVKRGNDLFVEFHSWYLFEFKEWMIDITNMEQWKKVRIRDGINAKIDGDVLNMLKDWLNKDFNSWIAIEDDNKKSNNAANEKEDNGASSWDDNEWDEWDWDGAEWEDTSETTGEGKEDTKPAENKQDKKLPEWAKATKKK